MAHDTIAERLASRYIPKNAVQVTEDATLGVVYVYPFKDKFGAIAYRGTAGKSDWHYTFRTDARMDETITKWFEGLRAHQAYKATSKAARSQPHNFKVGDIVTNSWGYDQTNVDWYRVTKTSTAYVWLEQISGACVPDEGCGPMSGMSTPHIDVSSDDPAKWGTVAIRDGVLLNKSHKHRATGSNVTFRHGSGSKWDGRPRYESWYA